jgi:hypothetical protein
MALPLIHTLCSSLQQAMSMFTLCIFTGFLLVTVPNALGSSDSVFHGSGPRWLEATSRQELFLKLLTLTKCTP